MPRIASRPELPSVTEVLADVGLTRAYPPDMDPKYSQLGHAVHETLAWHAEGLLDDASMHPDVRVRFDAYLDFLAKEQHVPFVSEVELIHDGWGVVGHADRVGSVGDVETALIDWKCSDSVDLKGATLQVGAYRALWNACHPERPVERGYVVALQRDSTYRLIDVTDTGYAESVFLAALIIFKARTASSEKVPANSRRRARG